MAEPLISSVRNPKVKRLLLLQQKSSERRKTGLFVVEGIRELRQCLAAGYEVDTLFYCDSQPSTLNSQLYVTSFHDFCHDSAKPSELVSALAAPKIQLSPVTPAVYEKIAYRGSTEGVVAIVKARRRALSDLSLKENPLIVVLEGVEKPGNLGAVLRSADAAAADAVIICDPLTDLYNPNLIRSSIGAAFTVPCMACSSEECIAYLRSHHIRILTAQLQDSTLYYHTDMRSGTALVMGTESTGLTDVWRRAADAHIRIPMLGSLDSLNVSVSAAILLFEAVRQRQ